MHNPHHRTAGIPLALAMLALLGSVVLDAGAVESARESFYDAAFDGAWLGTITTGGSVLPFQFNANVGAGSGVGYVLMQDANDGGIAVFAADFSTIRSGRITLRIDDTRPLRAGAEQPAPRFATATLRLAYDGRTDTVKGRATGSLRGRVAATRIDMARPLQRLWSVTARINGEDTAIALAPQEDADGQLSGSARVGGESGALTGTRDGNRVELSIALPTGTLRFGGALKARNNKLQGTLRTSAGASVRLAYVPADGNGRTMKLKSIEARRGITIAAGEQIDVSLLGKNFALGAIPHFDSAALEVRAIEFVSPRRINATLAARDDIVPGTAVTALLFNADGETAVRSNALAVAWPPGTVSYSADVQPIFDLNCAVAGCHVAVATDYLSLEAGVSYDNIVGVRSPRQPLYLRVDPGKPDISYLIRKLEDADDIVGVQMPLGSAPLRDEQIALIRTWIAEGAQRN
jgi:hypothetical protein